MTTSPGQEPQISASEAVWDALEACGVDQVYGIPGAVTVRLYNALFDRRDRFNVVLTRHEQTAAGMAEGYGRATRRPAVLLGQGAFVATNGGEPIIEAFMSGTPMLIIADASINAFSQHGVYQSGTGDYGSFDLRQIMSGMTKYVAYATTPKETVQGIQLAYKHATSGRPGPTCVIVKDPSALGMLDPNTPPIVYSTKRYLSVAAPVAPPDAVKRAADLIIEARTPVIVSGNGVHHAQAYRELQEFAEFLGAGVATSYRGKGTFAETHPQALGVMGLFPEKAANAVVSEADLIIAVGTRLSPSDTANENPLLIDPSRQKILHVDVEPRNIGWTFPVDEGLVGDAGRVIRQIIDEMRAKEEQIPADERAAHVIERKADHDYFHDPESESTTVPTRPERAIAELNKALAPDAIVSLDAGNNRVWTTHYFQVKQPGPMLIPGGTAGMGWGPPAILGAKIAFPDRQCVSVSGDGGFGLSIQAVPTAVDQGLAVVFVVLNDSGLGMVMRGQGDKLIASEFRPIDYAELARVYGAKGYRITEPDQLGPALTTALQDDGPSVIDIVIDPGVDYLKMRATDLVGYQYRAI